MENKNTRNFLIGGRYFMIFNDFLSYFMKNAHCIILFYCIHNACAMENNQQNAERTFQVNLRDIENQTTAFWKEHFFGIEKLVIRGQWEEDNDRSILKIVAALKNNTCISGLTFQSINLSDYGQGLLNQYLKKNPVTLSFHKAQRIFLKKDPQWQNCHVPDNFNEDTIPTILRCFNLSADIDTLNSLLRTCKKFNYYAKKQYNEEVNEIYQEFLKGKLIYKPNQANDDENIEFPINDLANPLKGKFDLSRCGDLSQYLSISIGYRKEKNLKNTNELEIWIAPRFLVEKDLIHHNWSEIAPIAIFWVFKEWGILTPHMFDCKNGLYYCVDREIQLPLRPRTEYHDGLLKTLLPQIMFRFPLLGLQIRQTTLPPVAYGYEEIYLKFLNGKLIYKPNEGSDEEKIELPIIALENPLEGEFDLSQCGNAGQHLSISTGYRKRKKPENANKVEVWFAPRFLIEEIIKTTRKDFHMDKWSQESPIGIFWTWGGYNYSKDWDDYSFVGEQTLYYNNLYGIFAHETTHNLASQNKGVDPLFYKVCPDIAFWPGARPTTHPANKILKYFMFSLNLG
jgi:hypothetical protein